MQYWIDTGNKKHGPFTAAQLRKLALKGELKQNHKLSTDQKRWVVAESVKGLEFNSEENPAPDLAGLFDEEFGDDAQLAPALPLATSRSTAQTNESNRLRVTAASQKCPDCSTSLRVIRKNGSLTGKMLCAACDSSPGSCPVCTAKLASEQAQQCLECGSSWHAASSSKQSMTPDSAKSDQAAKSARPSKEAIAERLSGFVISSIFGLIGWPLFGLVAFGFLGLLADIMLSTADYGAVVVGAALGFCAGFGVAVYSSFQQASVLATSISAELGESLSQQQKDLLFFLFAFLLSATISGVITWTTWERYATSERPPKRISIEELQDSGMPDNQFVVVTGAYPEGRPGRFAINSKSEESSIYVLLRPYHTPLKRYEGVRVIANCRPGYFRLLFDPDLHWDGEVCGMLGSTGFINDDDRDLLTTSYTGLEIERCLVLYHEEEPSSIVTVISFGLLTVASLIGAAYLVVRFIRSVRVAVSAISERAESDH